MANRNRTSGHIFEREVVGMLKDLGFDVVTSRYESKRADDAGIDIVGDFPFKVQCKSQVNTPNIHKLITETEAEVVFWRKQKKKNNKFYKQGDYALIPLKEFLNIFNYERRRFNRQTE